MTANQLHQIQQRARLAGVVFDVDQEDIPIPTHCPALGVELRRGDVHDCPSLDRLDPARGYTVDNVAWVSLRANRIKNDATLAELYRVADWCYEEHRRRGIPASTRLRPVAIKLTHCLYCGVESALALCDECVKLYTEEDR